MNNAKESEKIFSDWYQVRSYGKLKKVKISADNPFSFYGFATRIHYSCDTVSESERFGLTYDHSFGTQALTKIYVDYTRSSLLLVDGIIITDRGIENSDKIYAENENFMLLDWEAKNPLVYLGKVHQLEFTIYGMPNQYNFGDEKAPSFYTDISRQIIIINGNFMVTSDGLYN